MLSWKYMSNIVKQEVMGDIRFGAPADVEMLNRPWGFYEFLGVPKNASQEQIKMAYRRKAKELHPDKGIKDDEGFKQLGIVLDILLDDGEDIGKEHSKRRHYNEVSELDAYFDGVIELGDRKRTKRFSEIMLEQMQIERKYAKAEAEIIKKEPRFAELKEKLKTAHSLEKEEIFKEMKDLSAKAAGISAKERRKIEKAREEQREKFEAEQRDFARDFSENPKKYFKSIKALDVLYLGGDVFASVEFGREDYRMRINMAGHEIKEDIIFLTLLNSNYIAGFSQVHFKAMGGDVKISDPNLKGIFHVVSGTVRVDLPESSYGDVIRARAPVIPESYGFTRRGDLYVPKSFAKGKWWGKTPALDIAVKDGSVSLNLRSQRVAEKSLDYITKKYYSLENIIKDYSFEYDIGKTKKKF